MTTDRHSDIRRLDALTSLRFFAALMVLVYHYWQSFLKDVPMPAPLTMGYAGVSFFFLLSGFILAYNYEQDGRFANGGFRRYAIGRAARIFPTYLLSIVVFLPFLASAIAKEGLTAKYAAALLATPLALQAWLPGSVTVINYPGWSISTEMFFYLVFPFLVGPAFRRPERTAALALLFLLATWTVQSLVWAKVAPGIDLFSGSLGSIDPAIERIADTIKYFPPTRAGEFVLGVALCALWRKGRVPRDGRLLLTTALGAGAALVVLEPVLPQPALFNGATVVAWVPLVLWGAGASGGVLGRPMFVLAGRISFALYLLHATVAYYAHAVDKHLAAGRLAQHPELFMALTAAVAVLTAIVVFDRIEEPMRRWVTRRWARPTPVSHTEDFAAARPRPA
ncbi:MAG: acyltransferase [Siculibacillus sp.]